MNASIRNNLSYKILALILSIGLWADVKLHQEPVTLPIQLRLEVRGLSADVVAATNVTQVTVVLYGPKVYVSRMTAESENLHAYVDLRGNATPGQRKEEVKVELPPRLSAVVSLLSVAPQNVDVRVRRVTQKPVSIAVDWSGSPIPGAQYGVPNVNPKTVMAKGPDEAINDVDHAVVTLPGGDPHVNGSFPVIPVDKNGDPVNEVTLTPGMVAVEALLTATEARQQAFVSPAFVGLPAPGFRVIGVRSEPQVVTLIGPPALLRDISSVRTRPLSLGGARGNISRTVYIAAPRGVISQPASVLVRIEIKPAR